MQILEENGKLLLEAKLRELINQTRTQTPKLYSRSDFITPRYLGISKFGIFNFQTNSQTHNDEGAKWYQTIEIPDMLNYFEEEEEITPQRVSDMFNNCDVKLYCDDPSFLYWAFQYKATMKNYVSDDHPETRTPKRNNRRLKGALCKHLAAIVDIIMEGKLNEQFAKDITNFRLYSNGDAYKSFNRGRLIHQAKEKTDRIDWQTADSFMNDYFASKAGINKFINKNNIKGSLEQEIDRTKRAFPSITLDEFLQDEFDETLFSLSNTLGISEEGIQRYFKTLGLE